MKKFVTHFATKIRLGKICTIHYSLCLLRFKCVLSVGPWEANIFALYEAEFNPPPDPPTTMMPG